MTLSLRLSDEDATLIRRYADMNGLTVSELVRRSVIERIEDEFDLKLYEKAMADFKADPVTYSWMEWKANLASNEQIYSTSKRHCTSLKPI